MLALTEILGCSNAGAAIAVAFSSISAGPGRGRPPEGNRETLHPRQDRVRWTRSASMRLQATAGRRRLALRIAPPSPPLRRYFIGVGDSCLSSDLHILRLSRS